MTLKQFVLAAATLAAACSSDNQNDKACTDSSTAFCARLMACSSTEVQRRFGDLATCQTRQKLGCLNGLSAPGTGQTAARQESCAAAYPAFACNDLFNGAPTACQPPVGTRANGAACTFSGQCTSSYCAIPDGSNCGTCADLPKVGDSCATLTTCGGRGLTCANATQLCAQPGALGAACGRGQPCLAPLSCVGSTAMQIAQTGACQTAGATVGTACDPRARSMPGCARTLGVGCDSTANMCVAVTFVAEGDDCDNVTTLCPNGSCFGASGTTTGTCHIAADDGAPCDSINGPDCLSGSRCVGIGVDGGATGTCTLPVANGC